MALPQVFDHMFQLPLPIIEKLLRPVVVYLVLVLLLRLFGKRELAQLNPFDLVVLLSLSNTVQNAIIGDDNSVTGGIIGAFGLLAINWLVVRVLFSSPRLTRMLEGRAAILIRNGQIDLKALAREYNGSFYVEAFEPSIDDKRHTELIARLDALSRQVAALRPQTAGD
ncbi:MAG: DUF421 domain-containing protein [Terracidiphilus sp.]